jgi:uncharacterized membrane protein YhaH (DUF805 family)
MNFSEAVRSCFTQYATFSGRASRYEFWNFIFFLFIVSIVLTVVNSLIFGPTTTGEFQISIDGDGQQTERLTRSTRYDAGMLGNIFWLLVVIPWFAVTWRRLHDTGRPGWYGLLPVAVFVLAGVILFFFLEPITIDTSRLPEGLSVPEAIPTINNPLILLLTWLMSFGSIVLVIVWLCRASDHSTNQYGPNPHEVPS